MTRRQLLAITPLLILAPALLAADWPQFRGPNRDDVSTETGLLKTWPENGPPLAWTAKGLGGGFSSITVVGDRVFTLGNQKGVTQLVALERDSGKLAWTSPVGPAGGNLGCTPTVSGDRVYALGQQGDLVCIDTAGKRVWQRNLKKEFGGEVGGWAYCESPLVDGDRVIVTPGGKDATLVALNKANGETLWKCPIALPDNRSEAGYSSVVVTKVGDVRHYVQLINGGLVGVSLDGKLLWKYERLGPNTANVPTPIVFGDSVYCSVGYGKGGALLQLKAEGKGVTAKEVYFKQELTNKHGGVVKVGDRLYGDTDDSGRPFCADVQTGKVLWKRKDTDGEGRGSASVTSADGKLYFHYTNGWVALVEADGTAYKEVGGFQVPKRDGESWSHPVVSGGRLYLREGDFLYCYDIREKK